MARVDDLYCGIIEKSGKWHADHGMAGGIIIE